MSSFKQEGQTGEGPGQTRGTGQNKDPRGFVLGREGRPENTPFTVSETPAGTRRTAACPQEDTQRHGIGERGSAQCAEGPARALRPPRLRTCTCVVRELFSPAKITILWQEDVAYCQEQILSDTWVIVGDRGKWVGRKAPGSRVAKEHVGQENDLGPGPESMCQAGTVWLPCCCQDPVPPDPHPPPATR